MKKAFSLIELLIVIVIIGVVYTMSVGTFKDLKDKGKKLTLGNLKEYLQSFPYDKSAELSCFDKCSKCFVLLDGEKVQELNNFLDSSVITYRYDFSYGMQELENKDGICFSYKIDKKGVGYQVLVEYKDTFYDFSKYLSSVAKYSSLEEATDAKEALQEEVLR